MAEGWISIHRKIRDCEIWDYDEPFTRRDAWIDLLLLANHRDKNTLFDGKRITIKKGQYLTSVRKLAEEWHWGNEKTLKYLRLLEECEMITRESNSRRTLITIVNYGIYQNDNVGNRNTDRTQSDTLPEHSSSTNNNDNNENNKKKEYPTDIPKKNKRFIPPTVEEVRAYCEERKNGINPERFVAFYESKGWMVGKNKMTNWKSSVITWEIQEKKKGGAKDDGGVRADISDREAEERARLEYINSDEFKVDLPFM